MNGNGGDEVNQPSTWVDSFVKLDHLFGGSLFRVWVWVGVGNTSPVTHTHPPCESFQIYML
jgi:hypothetical protein